MEKSPAVQIGSVGAVPTRMNLDTSKILELVRVIIYGAAVGIVVHIAGTSLHGATAAGSVSPYVVELLISATAIAFVMLDGITRYWFRWWDEPQAGKALPLIGVRFICEIIGLFAFCYWAALVLEHHDPLNRPAVIFIGIFALCTCLHNLASLIVIETRRCPPRGVFVCIINGFMRYLRVLTGGDVLEDDLVNRLSLFTASRVHLHSALDDPGHSVTLVLKAALIRLGSQMMVIHLILFHLLIGIVSICQMRLAQSWLDGSNPNVVLVLVVVLLTVFSFIFYYITSHLESVRRDASNPQAARRNPWEAGSQLAGNLCLLAAWTLFVSVAELDFVYGLYAGLMVSAIALVFYQHHPEPKAETLGMEKGQAA